MQILYVAESFYNLEPVFAVIATIAQFICTNSPSATAQPVSECRLSPSPIFTGTIIIPENVDQLLQMLPRRREPDQPPHPIVRALGSWPDYYQKLYEELSNPAVAVPFAKVTDETLAYLNAIGEHIFAFINPYRPRPFFGDKIRAIVCNSAEDSCKAGVLASVLRRSFIKAEIRDRRQRILSLGI